MHTTLHYSNQQPIIQNQTYLNNEHYYEASLNQQSSQIYTPTATQTINSNNQTSLNQQSNQMYIPTTTQTVDSNNQTNLNIQLNQN